MGLHGVADVNEWLVGCGGVSALFRAGSAFDFGESPKYG